jgi:hypothetical protein
VARTRPRDRAGAPPKWVAPRGLQAGRGSRVELRLRAPRPDLHHEPVIDGTREAARSVVNLLLARVDLPSSR